MSTTDNSAPNKISSGAHERPIVTSHAELRYLQRVDANCYTPAAEIRRMFRLGHLEATPDVDHGHAIRHGGFWLVYQQTHGRPIITTVLRAT